MDGTSGIQNEAEWGPIPPIIVGARHHDREEAGVLIGPVAVLPRALFVSSLLAGSFLANVAILDESRYQGAFMPILPYILVSSLCGAWVFEHGKWRSNPRKGLGAFILSFLLTVCSSALAICTGVIAVPYDYPTVRDFGAMVWLVTYLFEPMVTLAACVCFVGYSWWREPGAAVRLRRANA